MSEAVDRAVVRRLIHDARTPLTVIAGFAELLVRDADSLGETGRSDAHRRIHEAALELRKMLDDADEATSPQ
jgi:K+-sensing histidine kinase KdpD